VVVTESRLFLLLQANRRNSNVHSEFSLLDKIERVAFLSKCTHD
jgi:hypothetical protein